MGGRNLDVVDVGQPPFFIKVRPVFDFTHGGTVDAHHRINGVARHPHPVSAGRRSRGREEEADNDKVPTPHHQKELPTLNSN